MTAADYAQFNSLLDKMRNQAYYLIGLAIATMILSYFKVAFWVMPAEKQSRVIRKNLFISILRQDIGWFDTYKSEELNNRLTE
jgi:ATP-binding cassette subfamily B (MDR/TAP) protein 1